MLQKEFMKRRRGVVGIYLSKDEDAYLKRRVEEEGGSVSQIVSRIIWEAAAQAKPAKG